MFGISFRKIELIAVAALGATLAMPALSDEHAANEDGPVATVNGVVIPKSRFDLLLFSQTSQGQEDTPAFREELREIMITREVLVQEANRRALQDSNEYEAQIDAMKQQLLISLLFNELIQELEPSEETKRAEYERVKNETAKLGGQEYRVRHILVNEEKDALKIIEQLKGGADFAMLATEQSADTGTRENGGDLGWAEPQRYVKPFADAVVALQKGETTATPVKSDFGYHVIELVDVRPIPFPPYEEVEENVRKELLTRYRDELITRLRDAATIERIGALDSE